MKKIEELELHERMTIREGVSVIRVPGGLIYQYTEMLREHQYEAFAISTHTQFVPFRQFNNQ